MTARTPEENQWNTRSILDAANMKATINEIASGSSEEVGSTRQDAGGYRIQDTGCSSMGILEAFGMKRRMRRERRAGGSPASTSTYQQNSVLAAAGTLKGKGHIF